MIRQQRRSLIREIDKQLKTLKKTLDTWITLRKTCKKPEEIANADNAIKAILRDASQLFLKRKGLVLNDPNISASRPSDGQVSTQVRHQDE